MLKKVLGTPWEYACLLLGNLLYGVGFNLFFRDNEIAAGGFGGLGLVVSHYLPVTVGTVILTVSIPVFLWSFRVQGVKYTLSALFSTVAFSAATDAFAFLPNVTENKLMAAVCGGIVYGIAAATLVRGNVSGSGSDLLGRLLVTKFRVLSLGTFVFLVDALVIALSLAAFRDLETSIYAVAAIFLTTYVTDHMISGFNRACRFEIITSTDPALLAEKVY
ncbi:MAG: YitT family protein, partial [bacterium]